MQLLIPLAVREQLAADAAERAYDLPNRLVAHLSMTVEPASPAMRTSVRHLVYGPKAGQALYRCRIRFFIGPPSLSSWDAFARESYRSPSAKCGISAVAALKVYCEQIRESRCEHESAYAQKS